MLNILPYAQQAYRCRFFVICACLVFMIGFLGIQNALAQLQAQSTGKFAIVINASNAVEANINEIKILYLKKKTSWDNGVVADPLGRLGDSPEQHAFLKEVLQMTQPELEQYWASEKSKTGATAPREVGSLRILLRQISRKEGAFGVIARKDAAYLPEGVKILLYF